MVANLWSEIDAKRSCEGANTPAEADLATRVYASRLMGSDKDLVLHGGGNASVKTTHRKDTGNDEEVIHVKGSGWDLATIQAQGFPGLFLDGLVSVRHLDRLDDLTMVSHLRQNLLASDSPNPSVETLLHAFLPAKYVDHCHAAAVLVIANQPNASDLARSIYQDRLAIVPYVMPGFDLSIAGDRAFAAAGSGCEGLFLVNHGLFTLGETAEQSYSLMIEFITLAEEFMAAKGISVGRPEPLLPISGAATTTLDNLTEALNSLSSKSFVGAFRNTVSVERYLAQPEIRSLARRGTITPDHVIRIKPFPAIVEAGSTIEQIRSELTAYSREYASYFDRNAAKVPEQKVMLDPWPRVILVPGMGAFCFGANAGAAEAAADLVEQTSRVVLAAEQLGRFTPITEAQLFEMEYWSLEQAKLQANP